jgi:cell division protein FtsB
MRIPLHWMLTTAGAILVTLGVTLWNIAGQSNKLDQLIITNAKLEKRLDDRDARVDALRDKVFSTERAIDTLNLRLAALERAQPAHK